jgi:hypothetical protein
MCGECRVLLRRAVPANRLYRHTYEPAETLVDVLLQLAWQGRAKEIANHDHEVA